MRELKFRGWANSGFVYFDMREDNDFTFHEFCSSCEADNIEQYIGLKDKNGKEIYEGDIVKCGAYSGKPIVFEEGRYWLGEEPDDLFVATVRWEIEVIGNIHENPELCGEEEE